MWNLKITTLLQHFVGGGIQFMNGDCNNINLINLLQPTWICTNIGINNVQDNLNMQRCMNAKKILFGFYVEKGLILNLINESRLFQINFSCELIRLIRLTIRPFLSKIHKNNSFSFYIFLCTLLFRITIYSYSKLCNSN